MEYNFCNKLITLLHNFFLLNLSIIVSLNVIGGYNKILNVYTSIILSCYGVFMVLSITNCDSILQEMRQNISINNKTSFPVDSIKIQESSNKISVNAQLGKSVKMYNCRDLFPFTTFQLWIHDGS